MDGRGLLQEGAPGIHHQWPGDGELEHRQMGRRLTGDWHGSVRFTRRVGAELQSHRRPHIPGSVVRCREQRLEVDDDGGWLPPACFWLLQIQLEADTGSSGSTLEQR